MNIFFILNSHSSGHAESKATLEPLKKILTHTQKKCGNVLECLAPEEYIC